MFGWYVSKRAKERRLNKLRNKLDFSALPSDPEAECAAQDILEEKERYTTQFILRLAFVI